MSSLAGMLFIFIFFDLLGMQLFGYKFIFCDSYDVSDAAEVSAESHRVVPEQTRLLRAVLRGAGEPVGRLQRRYWRDGAVRVRGGVRADVPRETRRIGPAPP